MTAVRQDAWSQDEDLLLAEVVLRHIREGSTQLAAFEEVGEKLSRTAAACGFRWNSLIRKQYESAITIAKKQRKERNKEKALKNESQEDSSKQTQVKRDEYVVAGKEKSLSMDDVILFLKNFKSKQAQSHGVESENKQLRKQLEELKKQNEDMQQHLQKLNEEYQIVCEDYKALIQIMDRARKMVVLEDEDGKNLTFKMDVNGNLQKMKK
ncbi:RsfA family transcriptional regulator [Fictibacillus sp. Mic-4]|uniref:RsfA family transcriptional regulator n=1 Tax=Fictibacillus TaxID=1329200 RepID=UPI000427D1E2|nr:RsfA family transcriptional regulator [Fictibacillus gelatini]